MSAEGWLSKEQIEVAEDDAMKYGVSRKNLANCSTFCDSYNQWRLKWIQFRDEAEQARNAASVYTSFFPKVKWNKWQWNVKCGISSFRLAMSCVLEGWGARGRLLRLRNSSLGLKSLCQHSAPCTVNGRKTSTFLWRKLYFGTHATKAANKACIHRHTHAHKHTHILKKKEKKGIDFRQFRQLLRLIFCLILMFAGRCPGQGCVGCTESCCSQTDC